MRKFLIYYMKKLLVLILIFLISLITGCSTYFSTSPTDLTEISKKDSMPLVYIPKGEFLMGSYENDSDAAKDEKPQHKVFLDAFWIDKTEVTNEMYNQCIDANVCTLPILPSEAF